MKNFFLIIICILLLAAGCAKVELKQEMPSSPKESYEELPK